MQIKRLPDGAGTLFARPIGMPMQCDEGQETQAREERPMRPLVSATLVNGPFGDPALVLDFRDAKRALMFDIGDIVRLAPRAILRVSDVFVSHAHMDHFGGLDRLLRVCLGRGEPVRLYGPPGFVDRVEHKLAAYTWNLADHYPVDFGLIAHEVSEDGVVRAARFRSGAAFVREPLADSRAEAAVLLDDPRFRVRAAFLDHGIVCLGFALEEKPRARVLREGLASLGLAVGPWLNDLKRAVADGLPDDTPIHAWWNDRAGAHERTVFLGKLRSHALEVTPGQKLAYVTDIRYSAENEARVAALAAGADVLFIESVFLAADGHHAARKNHLTAVQAGRIARAARVKRVQPFHFSPRYLGREAELVAELRDAFTAS